MEFRGKLIILIIIQFVSMIRSTSAHYCEWQTCNSREYCCGENICCGNSEVLFYVMIAVCSSLALLFFCCSIFFVCRYACRIGRPIVQHAFSNYRNLRNERNSSTTNLATTCDVEYNEQIYSDPPPPYSEVVQIRK